MNVPTTIDAGAWLGKYLEGADGDTDLARSMLGAFAEAIMSAQASMQCNAAYGERSSERENSRNGYRTRPWDTRLGTIELNVPKLRRGVYSPEVLLSPRRCTEQALVAVICRAYVEGVSTRRATTSSRPWASRACPSPRSRASPQNSTPSSPSSRSVPLTVAPTATSGSTP